ncbi:hypothetical protein RA277_28270, partial [Pseudomonas syringae pv. tagetis]
MVVVVGGFVFGLGDVFLWVGVIAVVNLVVFGGSGFLWLVVLVVGVWLWGLLVVGDARMGGVLGVR